MCCDVKISPFSQIIFSQFFFRSSHDFVLLNSLTLYQVFFKCTNDLLILNEVCVKHSESSEMEIFFIFGSAEAHRGASDQMVLVLTFLLLFRQS